MRRLFFGLLTAAAVAALPQLVLADDEDKPDDRGPKAERPDRPPAPGDRPGPPRDREGQEHRPGPPRGPEGAMHRGGPPRDFEGRGERGDRPDFAGRGPRPGGPPSWGDRSQKPWWLEDRSERSERPQFAGRGPRPGGPPSRGDESKKPSWGESRRPGPGPSFHGRGFRGPQGQGPRMPDPAEIFKRLDRNNDKQLSLDEFAAGMKRFHEDMAKAREKFAAAMRSHGPRPGGKQFGRPGGPPWAGRGMISPHVRSRLSSLSPEARKKAFEAMQHRFRDRVGDAGPHRHGKEARSHERRHKDDDRDEAKERRHKKEKKERDRDDDEDEDEDDD